MSSLLFVAVQGLSVCLLVEHSFCRNEESLHEKFLIPLVPLVEL